MARVIHKLKEPAFKPTDEKIVNFFVELHRVDKDAFEIAAHEIIVQIKYAKLPSHSKKPRDHVHLGNGTYENFSHKMKNKSELKSFGSS